MASWTTLKAAIAESIKNNSNQEITGQVLQNVLNNIVSSIGENATFAGIATPTTNPGTPDGPVFYLAVQTGTYSNFSGISVGEEEAVILLWNGTWNKKTADLLKRSNLIAISSKIDNLYRLKWMQGGVSSNGNYISLNSYYEVTDYIPVAPGMKLTIDIVNKRADTFNCGYDENKKFVTKLEKTGTINIPENVYYVRINNEVNYSKRSIVFEGSAFMYKGEEKKINNKIGNLESENETFSNLIYVVNVEDDLHKNISISQNVQLDYNNGSTSTYAGCYTSDYIDISEYKSLQINGCVCGSNKEVALACFYDLKKTFISSIRYSEIGKVTNDLISEIPENAVYMRFSYNTYGISGFNKVAIYVGVNVSVLNGLIKLGTEQYLKEIDLLNFNLGDYLNISLLMDKRLKSDGTTEVFSKCRTFDYVDITNIKKILVKNAVCNTNIETMLACFYDSNKSLLENGVIKYPIRGIEQTDILISVPNGAIYARFSSNIYNVSDYKELEINSILYYNILKEGIDKKESKPYAGKKILSLGDSYTYLNYYGKYLAETTGCEQRGRGVNGNFLKSFVGDKYTSSGGKEVTEVFDAELLSNYDIITVMGGTNDYGHSTHTLGNFETMKEDAALEGNCKTIYGSVYYIINKILTLKPSIRIYFCTQPFRLPYEYEAKGPGGYEENEHGLSMEKIADAIIDVCGHFGIPVFDFYRNSGWNPWTVKFKNPESPSMGAVVDNIYTYDGLHPKNGKGNGADLLGTSFGKFINSH